MNKYHLPAVLAICLGLLAGCGSGTGDSDGDGESSLPSIFGAAEAGANSSAGDTSIAGSSGTTITTSDTEGLAASPTGTVPGQIVGLWQDPNYDPPSYMHISDAGVLETYIPDFNGENCFLGSVLPRYLTHLGSSNYQLGYANISSTEELAIMVNGNTLSIQKTSANTGFTSNTFYNRVTGIMVTDLQLCD